ncbi:hypothetical protein DICSQDRAFT_156292 [Dichomitus squalens LYAD-421 SS1]|uniref:Uncharacterized protein n=1 Tax=Dichomitus squalens (strain LYAD-421) TaxID=732165 RepID=R7SU55_DICSQ|nr:uncharacterized protein DICSQDRAFT_156292 [Dichomitus squalens LYAD-421 SS1]EJF59453.1 hypothetical protein DICSQDRAFT_156292 [Dichomitus squalens LYAD-421 SS1]
MAVVSVLRVNLALTCVESALFGIFFVLAITSLAVLIARHGRPPLTTSPSLSFGHALRSPLLLGTILLLITVSGHWCATVLRLFQALLVYDNGQHPEQYYLIVEAIPHVVATASVITSVIVGDIILTYRVWVVWDRKLAMVIFPAMCICAYIAAGICVVELFAAFKTGESIFALASQRRVITTAALTLSTNIYGTGSIAYRIWSTNRALKHERMLAPALSLSEALVIFVESAALYTFWILFFLVSYCASSTLEAFAFHCIPAATGISFMLIIVRVGLGFSWSEIESARLGIVDLASLSRMQACRSQDGNTGTGYPPTIINLNVTRTVETRMETDFALPQASVKRDGGSDIGKKSGECV